MGDRTSRAVLCSALLVLTACNESVVPLGPPEVPPGECQPEASIAEPLQWKRVRALSSDLSAALELPTDQVCAELDAFSCSAVHIVPLGGNDPFANALYEPVERPMATTPMAVDRMVLGACANRAALDESGPAVVFVDVPPSDAQVDLTSPGASEAVDAQLSALYRRLLARAPEPTELTMLRELAVDDAGAPVTTRELDVLACYAIGTTTEFLFF